MLAASLSATCLLPNFCHTEKAKRLLKRLSTVNRKHVVQISNGTEYDTQDTDDMSNSPADN